MSDDTVNYGGFKAEFKIQNDNLQGGNPKSTTEKEGIIFSYKSAFASRASSLCSVHVRL